MEDGIENCHERSLQAANQVLLLFALQGTFLPSMVPIHPVVLEKKFVLHISHRVAMLTYVPRLVAILDFQSVQKVTTLG
jgi:hypothetical protein